MKARWLGRHVRYHAHYRVAALRGLFIAELHRFGLAHVTSASPYAIIRPFHIPSAFHRRVAERVHKGAVVASSHSAVPNRNSVIIG